MKILDKVYMMVVPKDRGVVYIVASSPADVWRIVVQQEVMGTGVTREYLHRAGYRVKKVEIVLP